MHEADLVAHLLKPLKNNFRYASNHVKYKAEDPMYTLISSFTIHVFKVTAALLLLGSSSLSTAEQPGNDTRLNRRSSLDNSVHSATMRVVFVGQEKRTLMDIRRYKVSGDLPGKYVVILHITNGITQPSSYVV